MAYYCNDQKIDNRPGNYYVSVISGPKRALVWGPFNTHLAALLRVERVRHDLPKIVGDYDSGFFGYGTARMDPGAAPLGRMNLQFDV